MGICNYCTLQRIRRRAEEDGQRVTVRNGWMGGTDVFVHPPDVEIDIAAAQEGHPQFTYWTAWLMSLGITTNAN